MKELVVLAVMDNLNQVTEFVGDELDATGCDPALQMQILIAVEEIFVNIAHYAYSPETGGAVIRVVVGDEISIEFEDEGKPYNPLEKADPDITARPEDRMIGGLGIFMVKKIMDAVEYRYENGKNTLLIKKAII
ncbi:MAG: ATP-binding protein [Oscillospiraceae bacterium]|nr:ATP-binding protein [Oscillospiraceae bacterium]